MKRTVGAIALGLTLATSVVGCGGNDDEEATSTTAAPTTVAQSTTASTSATPTAPSGAIAVDAAITDPDLGHSFKATSVVRNFPFPASAVARAERAELILVKVDITAGSKLYMSAGTGDLRLISSGPIPNSSTSIVDAEMTAAGYPPLKDVERGQSGSGWVAFVVEPKNSQALTLRYQRLAYSVSGGGNIAAQNFDVPLIK